MSKTVKDIIIDSLSEAYVNDAIIGIDQDYYKDVNGLCEELLPYLDSGKQPIEITETKCRVIISTYLKKVQEEAFVDGISVGCKLNNLKL